MRCALLSVAFVLAPHIAAACTPPDLPGAIRLESARHVLAYRPAPAPVPLNAAFTLDITACARNGDPVAAPRIDAWMPAHRHAMNYRPSLTTHSPGRFRAEGLLLHMHGAWELIFDLAGDRLIASLAPQ